MKSGPVLGTSLGLALAMGSLPALAQAPSLVVDASTGQVLVAEDATMPWNPASTTKMMTAYVALKAVREGRASLDSPLVASANAARQKPSKIGIRPGQEITLDNALKILMVKSANDLAVVVAEAIGGSVPGFSAMMNAEARRLGMHESRFFNPHGFHESGHQTSARDLAILALASLRDFPEHADLWGIGAVQLGNRTMHNTNGLIGRYPGANGFKTGFVCASGFNLVAMATKGGRTLVAVVLGASSGGDRVVRAAQLLDQGFSSWGSGNQTLRSLPSSGVASAPNMRQEICGRRRPGVILTDDADYGGAILADSFSGESMAGTSAVGFFQVGNGSSAFQPGRSGGGSAIRSGGGGRAILGPRVGIAAIPVHLGRVPGSTAVALGPGAGASNARAVADAAPPLRGTTIATLPVRGNDRLPPGISGGSALPASVTALAPAPTITVTPIETVRPAQAAAIRPAASNLRVEPLGAPMDLLPQVARETRPAAEAGIRARPQARTTQAQPARAEANARRTVQARPAGTAPKVQPARPRPKPANDE